MTLTLTRYIADTGEGLVSEPEKMRKLILCSGKVCRLGAGVGVGVGGGVGVGRGRGQGVGRGGG